MMIDLLGILKLLWIPILGIGGWFFRGLHEKYEDLDRRMVRLESTAITRDGLEAILDKKLEKFYEIFEKSDRHNEKALEEIKKELKDLRNDLNRK